MFANDPGFVERLVLAVMADVIFAVIYNRWVQRHQARNEGVYTSFYVAGGVLFTLATAVLMIGLHDVVLVMLLFVASGFPMVWGSMQRHTERIKTTNDTAIAEARELLHDKAADQE